jgi:outer membrane protein TolC
MLDLKKCNRMHLCSIKIFRCDYIMLNKIWLMEDTISLKQHIQRSWLYRCCFILVVLLPLVTSAAEEIKPGETLDLSRCIAISLKNHPTIKGAAGSLNASQSKISQARSGYYPQADLSSGYSRIHPSGTSGNLGSWNTSYDNYQGSLNLNGTILDFGKTSVQTDVQSLGAEAARADLDNTTSQVVLGVKQAYYGILQSMQSRDAYAQEVAQFRQHLDQAKKFYEVGTKPKTDVTKAEVDLSQARLNLLKADNSLRIARISLNNAMGVPDAPAYEVEDSTAYQDYPIDLATALSRGYEARPDLVSATAKREAAERSIDLARTGYYPVLSGNAGYGWTGQDFPLDKQWTVGAALNFPLFSGFLTRSQVEEARANLIVAKANEDNIRQGIRFEVEQAYYTLKNAREGIVLAEVSVEQAKENRELAQGRYEAGVGNSIEAADAVVLEINSKTANANALYYYRLSIANLERAMGVKQ